MDFDKLSDEQKAKVLACKTPEELLALARESGYELSDDELSSVSGGASWTSALSWECDGYKNPCPGAFH